LEREVAEMFYIRFNFKKDTRPLLLDYSRNNAVLLKAYPVEGISELYYDYFDQQLNFIDSDHIEL